MTLGLYGRGYEVISYQFGEQTIYSNLQFLSMCYIEGIFSFTVLVKTMFAL